MIGLILDIIGVATGTIGMVVAGLSYRDKRFIAAKQYLEAFGDPDFLRARKHVYNTPPCDMDIRDEQASLVVNFFHEWGLLAKQRYLPMWVFKDANKAAVIRQYEMLSQNIQKKRESLNDDTYAAGFTWLYKKLGGNAIMDQKCADNPVHLIS